MSDLISRQAAIDAVGYYSLHSGNKLLFADKPLKELPSAQQWIPCNTQEPDGIGCYLLYRPHFWRGNNGQITVCHWNGHRWSDNYTDDESRALPEVRGMAWMPLPEPWRGEEG